MLRAFPQSLQVNVSHTMSLFLWHLESEVLGLEISVFDLENNVCDSINANFAFDIYPKETMLS